MIADPTPAFSAIAPVGAAGASGAPRPPAALEAAEGFLDTLRAAERAGLDSVTTGGDSHELVTRMAEARLAVETVTAIRDRAVEAYQEILRMPV
jgi:flagellar hook-basal body complex protein FliE